MQIRLDYGITGLSAEIPEHTLLGVLQATDAAPLADPDAAIRAVLALPIGAPPLAEIAHGKRTACIVVCDITRPVPNSVLLPPVLDALEQGGIKRENITILIATGTHRPNTGAEIDTLLGSAIARSGIRIVNHVCTDAAAHRDFGVTENGVPVRLDRTYTEADVKITVGLIEPHFMAGYSGGRKLVMPGIAALETVQAWHSPRFLEHPNATNGIVDHNPVHEENTRIASLCPPDLIVDVTLNQAKQITGVFAGEMVAAWRQGVEFAARHVRATVPQPADIVMTSGAGFPLDQTFYQAVKGMVGAAAIVKPGGDILIAAECAEGIGGPHFTQLLRDTDDLGRLMVQMQQPDWQYVPDQWQVEELARAARKATIRLICDANAIPPETARELFVTPEPSIEAALAAAFVKHGPNATIAVIPQGPYVIAAMESALPNAAVRL